MTNRRPGLRFRGIKEFILTVPFWTIPLLAVPSAWAQSDFVNDCQTYSRVALSQVDIVIGKNNGGFGEGCPGAVGPRWTKNKAAHFTWCQHATPADRAAETEARRQLLLDCTRKRGAQKWDMWDTKSWGTYSAGSGGFGGSEQGKKECNDQGTNILNATKRVRQDQGILWNPVKDETFYNSRYYHQFQHWKNFSCDLVQHADGSKGRSLVGYTGEGVAERPPVVTKPVDPADLGIKQKPRGNVFR